MMKYEEIMQICHSKWYRYKLKHLKYGKVEWELGYVTAQIIKQSHLVVLTEHEDKTTHLLLFGIPVRINREVPELIKLWEEVE